MNRKLIFRLATLTWIGFSIIGYLIIENYLGESIRLILQGNFSWYYQVFVGSIGGIFIALIGWEIITIPILQSTKIFFVHLIKPLQLTISEIVYISFCAGVGEEILFRGAIQPLLGIWLTAVVFVAIHGYLNPFNWRLSIYGVFMTVAIVGIGLMTIRIGLLSSIIAHIMIDVILLYKLSHATYVDDNREEIL